VRREGPCGGFQDPVYEKFRCALFRGEMTSSDAAGSVLIELSEREPLLSASLGRPEIIRLLPQRGRSVSRALTPVAKVRAIRTA